MNHPKWPNLKPKGWIDKANSLYGRKLTHKDNAFENIRQFVKRNRDKEKKMQKKEQAEIRDILRTPRTILRQKKNIKI